MNNPIPSVCNCSYQDELFEALEKTLKKFHKEYDLETHELVYTMAQLGTLYLRMVGHTTEEITDFYGRAINSLFLKEPQE